MDTLNKWLKEPTNLTNGEYSAMIMLIVFVSYIVVKVF